MARPAWQRLVVLQISIQFQGSVGSRHLARSQQAGRQSCSSHVQLLMLPGEAQEQGTQQTRRTQMLPLLLFSMCKTNFDNFTSVPQLPSPLLACCCTGHEQNTLCSTSHETKQADFFCVCVTLHAMQKPQVVVLGVLGCRCNGT